jgi:hypothetical protein
VWAGVGAGVLAVVVIAHAGRPVAADPYYSEVSPDLQWVYHPPSAAATLAYPGRPSSADGAVGSAWTGTRRGQDRRTHAATAMVPRWRREPGRGSRTAAGDGHIGGAWLGPQFASQPLVIHLINELGYGVEAVAVAETPVQRVPFTGARIEITGSAGPSRDQKGAGSPGSVEAGGGRAPPGAGGSGRRRIGPSIRIRPS